MVPRVFPSPGDWLTCLLRRWAREGWIPNVVLPLDGGELSIDLDDGEMLVALIRTADCREILLTSERVLSEGRTLFKYGEIGYCHWIIEPGTTGSELSTLEIRRLKQDHFDRLIVVLDSGDKVVLERLGQVVFPLEKFFNSVITAVGPNAPTRG
jgi:hypothetical protein